MVCVWEFSISFNNERITIFPNKFYKHFWVCQLVAIDLTCQLPHSSTSNLNFVQQMLPKWAINICIYRNEERIEVAAEDNRTPIHCDWTNAKCHLTLWNHNNVCSNFIHPCQSPTFHYQGVSLIFVTCWSTVINALVSNPHHWFAIITIMITKWHKSGTQCILYAEIMIKCLHDIHYMPELLIMRNLHMNWFVSSLFVHLSRLAPCQSVHTLNEFNVLSSVRCLMRNFDFSENGWDLFQDCHRHRNFSATLSTHIIHHLNSCW